MVPAFYHVELFFFFYPISLGIADRRAPGSSVLGYPGLSYRANRIPPGGRSKETLELVLELVSGHQRQSPAAGIL